MRHDPPLPPPSLFPALTLDQAQQRMERASRLERADFLEILALEPESDLWVCRGLTGPGGAFELGGGAGDGGEVGEVGGGEHGGVVDEGAYEGVGGLDGGAGEGEGVWVRHCGCGSGDRWVGECEAIRV